MTTRRPNTPPESAGMDDSGADRGWDTYKERVLRNEGSLEGLRHLVSETREADRLLVNQRADSLEQLVEAVRQADARLIEQRSDSLAEALRDAREDLRRLMAEQREADRREFRQELSSAKELNETLRSEEISRIHAIFKGSRRTINTALTKNFEQSRDQIRSLDERSIARWNAMEQQVSHWREGDKEARDLQIKETTRRLEALNHAQATLSDYQSKTVPRELWQAGERTMNDKIVAVEKLILGLVTNESADRAHRSLEDKISSAAHNNREVSETRFNVTDEKINELKVEIAGLREARAGGTAVKTANKEFIGYVIAAVTIMIAVIVASNAIFGK